MIIYRYITREILLTMAAVSTTLLLIVMSGRFVKYLADAAAGKIAVDVLFSIMAFRLPGFLELVLPLGFFIAILLAFGRMHMDSEMVVLSACGMSQRQLLMVTLIPAVLMSIVLGALSLWVSPWGAAKTETLFAEQASRSEFTMLRAGHFQRLDGGRQVTYVESVSEGHTQLNNFFVAEIGKGWRSVSLAEKGSQVIHPEYGARYLLLHDGMRYQGLPGNADYRVTEFETLGQYLPPPAASESFSLEADGRDTLSLIAEDSLESQAALQWRLSMPLLVLVIAVMAVPLSRTSPRQGRYAKMLPAIVLYLLYVAALSTLRNSVEKGDFPATPGLWLAHIIFLLLAIWLFWGPGRLIAKLRRRP
ncbi:LPS export ABC transporter permease LptF [Gilvimarinus xylanilyticus]|uniref:Lipopolysaccharide export system permease protein LptF n=1 Tax=Gilvimarinus xylanilyticus TaxID=2944139 RepID=A0A9X2KSE5_9GAMM|nr:LPS export ABC transporter permease LptF [Gilvimarinus xylanilyticus]MCP8898751.1 LPS export ABC transporter permease LptF [Gilvimarinus xylanilyticus]